MNAKMIAPLVIVAVSISLESPVSAQLPATSNSSLNDYSLTGDSLVGIDHRTAEDDFGKFFEQSPASVSNNNEGKDAIAQESPYQESLSSPNTSVFFVPAQSFNGNDGAQVQLDLGNR
ncbi:MAG: hypothetical protein KME23_17930 [Goleter apudmare HA4340-LM2]|jgi:hypothetical protein|nr:hypothetical protein [Goleter apudmare HA4340-LM2]